MYKEILRSIAGVDVFPIISLCLFAAVFAVVVVKAFRTDKARLAAYAHLPLDDSCASADTAEAAERGATL